MPLRRSRVDALDVIAYTGEEVQLDLRVSSEPTCGRSQTHWADTAGRCAARDRSVLGRRGRSRLASFRPMRRWLGCEGRAAPGRARSPTECVAADRQLRRSASRPSARARDRLRARERRSRWSRSGRIPGWCSATSVELLSTLERRIELLEDAGVDEVLVVEFTPELAAREPAEFCRHHPATDRRRGDRGRRELPLRTRAQATRALLARARLRRSHRCPTLPGVSSTSDPEPAAGGRRRGAARLLGRPAEIDGTVVLGDQRGGTLGYPTANLAVAPELLVPAYGIYAGCCAWPPRRDLDRRQPALRRRRAADRAASPRLRG